MPIEVLSQFKIPKAPVDDFEAARRIDVAGFPGGDAPTDGVLYGRRDGLWVPIILAGGPSPYTLERMPDGSVYMLAEDGVPMPLEYEDPTGNLYYVGPLGVPNPFFYDSFSGVLFYDFL